MNTYGNTYKGFYQIKNPEKYRGDPLNCIYRSSYEKKFMKYCDGHPSVVWWSSEELVIKYWNPYKKREARYFPDFVVAIKTRTGEVKTYVIEVKPLSKTLQPKKKSRVNRRFVAETVEYEVNKAKWNAAMSFCQENGWIFKIMTEKELNIK